MRNKHFVSASLQRHREANKQNNSLDLTSATSGFDEDRQDSTDSNWEGDEDCGDGNNKPSPPYDLSSAGYQLAAIKTFQLEGLPQSITRDPDANKDLTYVTDVTNNKILVFKGWQPKG